MKKSKFKGWYSKDGKWTAYRDWLSFEFSIGFSLDQHNELNCLFHCWIMFWGFDFSWNGRKLKRKYKGVSGDIYSDAIT